MASFKNVKAAVEKVIKKQLNMSHFQQIINVVPKFFNHQWELKGKNYELTIEIPKNIKQIVEDEKVKKSQEAFEEMMLSDLLEKRQEIFKRRLYNVTY